MQLSKASGYAISGLVFIAARHKGDSVGVREIAEFHGISRAYLAKIFHTLTRSGIVSSMRGVRGGYRLSRAADAITIADVVSAVDGPAGKSRCSLNLAHCPFHADCAICSAMDRVNLGIYSLFAQTTINDIVLRHEPFLIYATSIGL
jgi:Rrf2 family protein